LPFYMFLVSDAGTVKGYKVATIILVCKQDVRVTIAVVVIVVGRVLRQSYGILFLMSSYESI
jgi:hypothetical protein